jgi:hypothetical protein
MPELIHGEEDERPAFHAGTAGFAARPPRGEAAIGKG